MYYYLIILLIALLGFFLSFEFWGETGNTIFKIVLFFSLGYTLYKHYTNQVDDDIDLETKGDQQQSDNKDDIVFEPAPIVKIPDDNLNLANLLADKEFSLNSFIISQFEVLYNFFIPQNGYVFISDNQISVSIIYKMIKKDLLWKETNSLPNIIKLLDNHSHNILIENNLTPNSSIIPYYSDYSPGSVFGMKTNISGKQNIYWVFDAPVTGFFNEEELQVPIQVSFSTQYVLLNLFKMSNATKNLESEKLNLELSNQLNTASNIDELTSIFIDFLSRFFEANKLTVAFLNDNNKSQAQILKTIGQTDSIKDGYKFGIEEGLCGKVIKNNQVYLLDDIEKDDYFIPRFSKSEKSNFGLRSFLAVPIALKNEAVGMLSLEHKTPGAFLKEHKILLQEYIKFFNIAAYRFLKKKGE